MPACAGWGPRLVTRGVGLATQKPGEEHGADSFCRTGCDTDHHRSRRPEQDASRRRDATVQQHSVGTVEGGPCSQGEDAQIPDGAAEFPGQPGQLWTEVFSANAFTLSALSAPPSLNCQLTNCPLL